MFSPSLLERFSKVLSHARRKFLCTAVRITLKHATLFMRTALAVVVLRRFAHEQRVEHPESLEL